MTYDLNFNCNGLFIPYDNYMERAMKLRCIKGHTLRLHTNIVKDVLREERKPNIAIFEVETATYSSELKPLLVLMR